MFIKILNQYLQEDKEQQLFNQWIVTICLGLSIIFFYLNVVVLGYLFSILEFLSAGISLIGCFIRYRFLMWKHNHK
jgi:hypothetical protein